MNLKIFKEPDPSGKMCRIKYLLKNYPEELKFIENFSEKYNLSGILFKELVYRAINNIKKEIVCKNPNCNTKVKFKNMNLGYREFCSNKCVGTDPDIIKSKEIKSLKKYGTKTPGESKEIKEKIIKTNQKRYGHNSPMGNIEIQDKSKKTLMKNWGVNNPNKHPEIKAKRVESFMKIIDQYKKNYKITSLKKYGTEHPWMNKEIHNKTINKLYENYNEKINEIMSYCGDVLVDFEISEEEKIFKIKCGKCGDEYFVTHYNFNYRTKNKGELCTICNPVGSGINVSISETNILKFIKENYDSEIITNTREVISPYEIDIYIPDLKLSFEFNGLYWHSELHKDKNYHLTKTELCEEKGIQLIHIWEDDWLYKQDIVKSMILNKLGETPNKIYARKTEVKEITDSKLVRKFLNDNHIQGYSPPSHSIGLFYDEKLVSLMTFCKPRKMMGQIDKRGVYELSRFCNKINTSIVGGASRLLKYFINEIKPIKIFSFSDKSYSNGNLYNTLNFKFLHTSKINYHWVINKKRRHRYNYTKYKLIEFGYDSNKSERDIMYEDVGSFRIWNCGQDKWELDLSYF